MDIKEELFEILQDYIDVPSEDIDLDESLKMASGLNSFVFLSLVSTIEEHFGVHIPNDKIIEFKTLNDIIHWIEVNRAS